MLLSTPFLHASCGREKIASVSPTLKCIRFSGQVLFQVHCSFISKGFRAQFLPASLLVVTSVSLQNCISSTYFQLLPVSTHQIRSPLHGNVRVFDNWNRRGTLTGGGGGYSPSPKATSTSSSENTRSSTSAGKSGGGGREVWETWNWWPARIRDITEEKYAQGNKNSSAKSNLRDIKHHNHINVARFKLTFEDTKSWTSAGKSGGGGREEWEIWNWLPVSTKDNTGENMHKIIKIRARYQIYVTWNATAPSILLVLNSTTCYISY